MNKPEQLEQNRADQQLEQYRTLVKDYSKVLDLSSPKMLQEFETGIKRSQAFIDALESHANVLDVGSGAGLPAIPIAIKRPDIQITLCEIRSKRAAFLERAVSSLKLSNAKVYQGDVRKLEATFDVVTALWVGSLEEIYRLVKPNLNKNWKIMTRKGDNLEQEILAIQKIDSTIEIKTEQLEDGAYFVTLSGGQQ
jgi:16S rRNA (guanine527-N7)-methyltransferase